MKLPKDKPMPIETVFNLNKNTIIPTVFISGHIPLIAFLTLILLSGALVFLGLDAKQAVLIPLIEFPILMAYYWVAIPFSLIRKNQTPKNIVVSKTSIKIDEKTFNFDTIKTIKATPPSHYNGTYRKLIICEHNGRKTSYSIGFQKTEKDKVFPAYHEFLDILQSTLSDDIGKFQFDL